MTLTYPARRRPRLVAGLLVALISVAAALPAAVAGADPILAPDITGTWQATVHLTGEDPTHAIYSIGRDGQVTVVLAAAGSSTALGTWSTIDDAHILITTTGFRRSETGELQGSMTVRETATLAPTLDGFTTTGDADVFSNEGGKVLTLTVETNASRLESDLGPSAAGPTVTAARGSTSQEVGPGIGHFLALLGGSDNRGDPGSKAEGFRAIVWDQLADEQSAPNDYPVGFFNAAAAPLARGVVFDSPGGTLQVSSTPENAAGVPPRFGNINVSYFNIFKPISPPKLFSPIGSNIVDVTFFVPGSDTPGVSRGFGTVFVDVDTPHTTVELFDIDDVSLGSFAAPIANNGYAFLGVTLPDAVIHRVRITLGTVPLGPDDSATDDVVVLDDLLFGEPQPAG